MPAWTPTTQSEALRSQAQGFLHKRSGKLNDVGALIYLCTRVPEDTTPTSSLYTYPCVGQNFQRTFMNLVTFFFRKHMHICDHKIPSKTILAWVLFNVIIPLRLPSGSW